MAAKKSITVEIAGVSYRMRSDADATYVQTLAACVDQKMDEARGTSHPASTQKLAVLAAMNLADDLFQERRKRALLQQAVRESSAALAELLEQAERQRSE